MSLPDPTVSPDLLEVSSRIPCGHLQPYPFPLRPFLRLSEGTIFLVAEASLPRPSTLDTSSSSSLATFTPVDDLETMIISNDIK